MFRKKLFMGLIVGIGLLLQTENGMAMSLNVQDGEIGELLRSVARMGNINLILDESVRGQISLKLENEEPAEIIQNVARARGLAITKEGSTWIVAARGNLDRGFAQVHVIPVKYAPLEDLRQAAAMYFAGNDNGKALASATESKKKSNSKAAGSEAASTSAQENGAIKAENRVLADVSTGSLLVYGTADDGEAIRQLVKKLDVPASQISIETKVVSMSKENASKLGIQWDWTSLPQYNSSTDDSGNVTRPVFNNSGTAGGIVSFGKGPEGRPYEWQYSATLEALVTNGKAEVLSRPNIVTLQGQEAVINIGGEVPVPKVSTTNSTVTTSIEYRPAGIILKCRPMVNQDGYITSRIHTEVSSPQYVEEMNAYSFQKRSADTTVRLKDGETMVIGGLISSEEIKSMSKVPFLGDIPILGNLFKSIHTSKNNSEIFIILKASVIKD